MRIGWRVGLCRPALLMLMVVGLAAGCYSSNYHQEIDANVALLSDLSDKLADYCRAGFRLDDRSVSSEEMGEFYYALTKARSFAAMSENQAAKPSYRQFGRLLDSYGSFVQAADRYRLAAKPDASALAALMERHEAVRQQARLVLQAVRADSR